MCWPESRNKLVGDGGGAEEIGDSLGAERRSGLGENVAEREVLKNARSQERLTVALMPIDARKCRQKRSRRGGALAERVRR